MDTLNKDFIKQYLETALWSSNDESTPCGGEPMDLNYNLDDFDLDAIKSSVRDCLSFIADAEKLELLDDCDYSTAGHDFWLTRNGHGAGFWDGDYPDEIGEKLTELSRSYGEVHLYVAYNNKISL